MELVLPLVLASGSPRRREILDTMGIAYTVDISEVDESFSGSPDQMVMTLSERKARAVSIRHPGSLILAADTVVCADRILGKPRSPKEAVQMLSELSGNWHSVYTGITLINTVNQRVISRSEVTRVHFDTLDRDEIEAYVSTGDSNDKAGAYGIQGMAGMFIDRIEGSYSNVVGLPMALLRNMLKEISVEN